MQKRRKQKPARQPETINPAATPSQPKPEPAPEPAQPQPQPDLLRIYLSRFSHEQLEIIRTGFLVMILEAVVEMNVYGLQDIARFTDMVENEQGCSTPAENFVTGLLAIHYLHGGITPETLESELDPENTDGFRVNFDDAVDVTRRFGATYPEVIKPAA